MAGENRSRLRVAGDNGGNDVVTPTAFPDFAGETGSTVAVIPLEVAESAAARALDLGLANARSETRHVATRLGVDVSKVYRMRDPKGHRPATLARLVQMNDEEFESTVDALRSVRAEVWRGTRPSFVMSDDPRRAIREVQLSAATFDALALQSDLHGPALSRDDAEALSGAGAEIRRKLRRMDAALAHLTVGARR